MYKLWENAGEIKCFLSGFRKKKKTSLGGEFRLCWVWVSIVMPLGGKDLASITNHFINKCVPGDSKWLFMTFLSPSWRSLNLRKGHCVKEPAFSCTNKCKWRHFLKRYLDMHRKRTACSDEPFFLSSKLLELPTCFQFPSRKNTSNFLLGRPMAAMLVLRYGYTSCMCKQRYYIWDVFNWKPLSNQRLFIGPIHETMAQPLRNPFFFPVQSVRIPTPCKIHGWNWKTTVIWTNPPSSRGYPRLLAVFQGENATMRASLALKIELAQRRDASMLSEGLFPY